VGGQLPRALAKQLRQLAADEDTTVVALLEEAITDLLVKKAARTLRR
jgi:predicted transcriptional regulator